MKEQFIQRSKEYFKKDYQLFIECLNKPATHGFFLNTKKASREEILKMLDFEYEETSLTSSSFYSKTDNIGKTVAYELGLIYPQGIEASLPSLMPDVDSVKVCLDMCAAPGGKSINILNRLSDDSLLISNDYQYKRAQILSSNLERLGFGNVIITNKDSDTLAKELRNTCDLVVLDAPCSGEGMIRKYPEILDEWSINNIESLASLQSELLENAYKCLKNNGQILYSTCTFAKEEDENQIDSFLKKHPDMYLVGETKKYSFIDNLEGQFMALLKRNNSNDTNSRKTKKTIKNQLIDSFIKDNLDIDEYYLYQNNGHYYLSFIPLFDLGSNVMKYGIYLGDIINNRFEPNHHLYRVTCLKDKFKYSYSLNDDEYKKYISGLEIRIAKDDHYYLLTYNSYQVRFGKCSKGQLKNKYPKGLRRML